MTINQTRLHLVNADEIHVHGAALADLDIWDSTLTQLDLALTDAALARDRLVGSGESLAKEEAALSLSVEGKNETERKARLVLALAEDTAYQELLTKCRDKRLRLADADRRAEMARQRCRLLREAMRLQVAV